MRKFNFLALAANYSTYPPSQASPLCLTTQHEIALKRLAIMKGSSDGFKIATEDLKLRGPGEVIGQRQTGFDIFRIVDVNRDFELIKDARSAALDIIENRKEVCLALIKRWFPKFNLV